MLSSIPPLLLALLASGANDVSHWPPRVLRGDVPTTGKAARLPPSVATFARWAGELELDGWLGEGVLLLSDGCEKDAKELLAQAVGARAAVGRCNPASPMPTRDAPLVVFHLSRAALYRSLLDRLDAIATGQDGMLAAAREAAGFEIAEPLLCVVCAEEAATGRRGAPDLRANLLVHLVAHAFFDFGFGAAPEWLREGFALDVEAQICGEPDAFCRRGPHELARPGAAKGGAERSGAWTRRLADEWKGACDASFEELFALEADGYHEVTAWRALALVRWLRERRSTRFHEVVDAVADAQKAACAGSLEASAAAALQSRGLDAALGSKWRAEFLDGVAAPSGRAGARGGGKGSR
jgi:hypothetical protein